MSKAILEINSQQVERLVESLPLDDKIRLVRKLEKETWQQRWGKLLEGIDGRLKKYPLTRKEIIKEIEAGRKTYHAKRRN